MMIKKIEQEGEQKKATRGKEKVAETEDYGEK